MIWDSRIFRFPDPLLKHKNLIGTADPVPDASKSCFNVLCYVLCYMVILYGNHALMYYAIWSYYIGYMVLCYIIILYGHHTWTYYAILSSLELPGAPWCSLAKSCSNVLCYMAILYWIYSIMLYDHTIWESYFNIYAMWSSMVLPGAPWCALARWCEQGAIWYKATQKHSRHKRVCTVLLVKNACAREGTKRENVNEKKRRECKENKMNCST